ncbi:MAG TPA: hypothetical protein VF306_12955, partial [Pirellulales bacterium]
RRLQVIARQSGVAMPVAASPAPADSVDGADLFDGAPATSRTRNEALLHEYEQRLLVYADDERGSRRQTALRMIGMEIIHRPDFLPAIFWTRLSRYFEYGDWAEGRAAGRGKNAKRTSTIGPVFPVNGAKSRKWALPKQAWVAAGAAVSLIVLLSAGLKVARFLRGAGQAEATHPNVAQNPVDQPSPPRQPQAPLARSNEKTTGEQGPRPKPTPRPSPSAGRASPPAVAAPDKPAENAADRPAASKLTDKQVDAHAAAPDAAIPKMPDKTVAASADDEKPPTSAADDGSIAPSSDASGKTAASKDASVNDGPNNDGPSSDEPPASDDSDESEESEDPAAPPGVTADAPDQSVPTFTGNSRAYDTLLIWPWDTAPEKPKLILRGLEFVNRHLIGPGKIVATETSDGLDAALVRGEATPVPLATLRVTAKGLSFQWAKLGENTHPARECQGFLRRCVVKVESAGPPLYIALSKPSQLDPLPLSNAAGKLDAHALKQAAFPPLPDDELLLGPGRIVLDDGQSLLFGVRPTETAPYIIADPPREFQLDAVQVSWNHDEQASTWRVRVGVPDSPELAEENALLKKDRRLLSEIKKLLSVRRPSPSAMRSFKTKPREEFNARMAELADLIQHPSAPVLAAQPDDGAMSAYQQKLNQLIEAAGQAKDKLSKQITDRARHVEAQQRQLDRRMIMLRPHASSISAVIYREVDEGLQAPYVLLGDPAPPPRRERPAKDDEEDD